MMTEADKAVLDESFRNTRTRREAINVIIGKVEDDDLALDLNRQACKYVQLEEKMQKEYYKEKETPPEDSPLPPDAPEDALERDSNEYTSECQYRTFGRYDDSGKYKRHHRTDEGG